jgi:hypothetical protein
MAEVELVLVHPADRSQLLLRGLVMLEQDGLGIELEGFDDAAARALAAFVERGPAGTDARRRAPASVLERVRALPAHQQQSLARSGELHERVALERVCGETVWEGLLQNPKLTVPEVARIARKGTVPRALLDQICDNASWLRAGPVQRALLTNPRLGSEALTKVLRALPRRDLKLIDKQTAYPASVREAARRFKPSDGT